MAQSLTHLRERPGGRSSFPKGGAVSLGPGPQLDGVPWGWQSPVGPQDVLAAEVSKVPFGSAT